MALDHEIVHMDLEILIMHVTLDDEFAIWNSFLHLEFICLGLIMAFPDLALKLPELLFERVARGTPY